MTAAPPEKEYLTLREAVEEIPFVKRRTLTRYAKHGHVASIRLGNRYLIPRTEVERIKVEGLRKAAGA